MRRRYSVVSKFRKPLSLDGLFYSHGLMCASHPRSAIALVAVVVVVCSLPFFITPSGDLNRPKYWRSPWLNYRVKATPPAVEKPREELEWIIDTPSKSSGRTPSWFHGLPVSVIQQLYVNLEINCAQLEGLCSKSYYSTSKLAAAQVLSRMEHAINTCQGVMHPAATNLTRTLSQYDRAPPPSHPALPHPPVPTGVLSPLLDSFRMRWEELPLEYHSIKELIYGGFWEHEHQSVGVAHSGDEDHTHPSSSGRGYKQHLLGLSLLLKSEGRQDFVELVRCVEGLKDVWPDEGEKRGALRFMKHFFYEPEWSLFDFAPLMAVYGIVFLYITFSVGKIDLVKSKFGLGFTAFATVVAGLTMSLGVCTFFGLSISLSGSEIYPYVVIVIGLENILIIVKAVMSTPEELEVKYRIAVGLSKEGWAITRNFITLVVMTTMGVAFFNYTLKEFCIIALVGLVCDTFLQLVLFPTVLSIDLRRLELSDLSSTPVPVPDKPDSPTRPRCPSSLQMTTPSRWRSKRVKFIYFLARTRIVSRLLMLSFITLLCALLVQTDAFHAFLTHLNSDPDTLPPTHPSPTVADNAGIPGLHDSSFSASVPTEELSQHSQRGQDPGEHSGAYWAELNNSSVSISRRPENGFRLKCKGGEVCWRPMVTTHWPRLFNHSGHNMEGRFLTLLPPIFLDMYMGFTPSTLPASTPSSLLIRLLYHSLVIRVTTTVLVVSLVLCYVFGLIRSSRFRHERYMQSVRLRGYNRMVCLKGHSQDVDFLCADSGLVVTTSLDGDIRVWDANPMKRRCARVIARSELCREPPPGAASSSQRPAAEGCEADNLLSNGGKHQPSAISGRRGSVGGYLSRSSSTSDFFNRAQSNSRLSSVSDVSSWDPLDLQRSKHFPASHAHIDTPTPPSPAVPPGPAAVPVRRYSSQVLDSGQAAIYTSPHPMVDAKSLKTNSLPSRGRGSSPWIPNTENSASSQAHAAGHVTGVQQPSSLVLQNRPHPSSVGGARGSPTTRLPTTPTSGPHPFSASGLHPSTHTWNVSKPHPNSAPNQMSHDVMPRASSVPYQLSAAQPHSVNSASLSNNSNMEPEVKVQLEPDMPVFASTIAHSSVCTRIPESPTHTGNAGPTPQPFTNSSARPPVPPIQALSSSTSSTPPAMRVDKPNIKVDHIPSSLSTVTTVPPSSSDAASSRTAISQMRRLGHSRHLSLDHHQPSGPQRRRTHTRNRSQGSINPAHVLPQLSSLNSNRGSCSNLSVMSNASVRGSDCSNFLKASQLTRLPDPDKGYDFAQHFNLFSQYTSDMALEYCGGLSGWGSEQTGPSVPPVWCMAFWNRVVAVGCRNGQLEAWNANTGSLVFNLSIGTAGITSITMSSAGIITGQMDGTLSLVGYNGLLHHCVPAHDKAISVLRWYDNKIITGGYDKSVKVHRTSASLNHLVCVNSVYVHEGNITAVAVVESQLKLGCVSACSKGLVIHWDINTGSCINEFGMYKSPVLQLEPTIASMVGLFGEGCVRVWDIVSGNLLHTITLDGVCHDLTVLSSQHIALSLESSVEVYDLETGKPHSEKPLETERGVSGVSLVRHVQALDGASVVCSSGKDVYIIPCDLKLKTD